MLFGGDINTFWCGFGIGEGREGILDSRWMIAVLLWGFCNVGVSGGRRLVIDDMIDGVVRARCQVLTLHIRTRCCLPAFYRSCR